MHVCFTPDSDIDCVFRHVRFGPKADMEEETPRSRVTIVAPLTSAAAGGTSALIICANRAGDPNRHLKNSPATFIRMPIVGMFHTSERANGKSAVYRIA